jgi:hypothetical protein
MTMQKETSRHLEWLKHVKESHGSVEVDVLSQAQAINTRGIYTVGHLQTSDKGNLLKVSTFHFNSIHFLCT